MRRAGGGGRLPWRGVRRRSCRLSDVLSIRRGRHGRGGADRHRAVASPLAGRSAHARSGRWIGGRHRHDPRQSTDRRGERLRGGGAVALAVAVALVGCAVAAYLTSRLGVERVRMKPRAARAARRGVRRRGAGGGGRGRPRARARGVGQLPAHRTSCRADAEIRRSGSPSLSGERRHLWAVGLGCLRPPPDRGCWSGHV